MMERVLTVLLLGFVLCIPLSAHEDTPITHTFAMGEVVGAGRLTLDVVDAETGESLAARFTLEIEGETHVPGWVSEEGVRFTSSHTKKKQVFVATYTRGDGAVEVSLPSGAKRVRVIATKGFEYRVAEAAGVVVDGRLSLEVKMRKWIDLEAAGWVGVDEHLHYDRLSAEDDDEWLAMLDGDGLGAGHFMVLKGAMVEGVWAWQYAYGEAGQASNGKGQLVVPGQEYRDSAQGHINLLGVNKVVEPISTGGLGVPTVKENFPPLHDVFLEAKARDALVGVAHAGTLGKQPTAVADAVLGAMDYWELSNGFIYSTDNWYRLMNCGVFLAAIGGTDLPNSPLRDSWQPMLGSIRTYVQTDGARDFESFKSAVKQGKTFISGGLIVSIKVNGLDVGGAVALPGGGDVVVEVELASPRLPRELVLIKNGKAVAADIQAIKSDGIHRWRITQSVQFDKSGWLSAWGKGARLEAQRLDAIGHAGVVRVLVGDGAIESRGDAEELIGQLRERKAYYQAKGVYENEVDRGHAVGLFDEAIKKLATQTD